MSTISAGTTSTTALVSSGDTTGNLVFQTNGTTTAMTVDTSQNVKIGTSAPALKLAVKTSDTAAIGYFGGTTYATRCGANANTATVEGVDAATGTSSYQPLQVGGSLLTLATGGSERMRIDSSGNVGIGTSSVVSPARLDITKSSTNNDVTTQRQLRIGGDTNSAYSLFLGYGQPVTGEALAGTIQALDNNTGTKLLLNPSGGNVGIGTSSPGALLQVNKSDASTTIGGSAAKIVVQNNNGSTLNQTSGIEFNVGNLPLSQSRLAGVYGLYEAFNATALGGALVFATNSAGSTTISERMRIDSSGNLMVGATSSNSAKLMVGFTAATNGLRLDTTNTNSTRTVQFVYNGSTEVGYISTTTTATTYNSASDYRLKDNPQPLTNSGAFIDALKPKTWQWKVDGSRGVGFIAHEVQEVSPSSVVGEKDAVDEDGSIKVQAMEYGSAEFIANIVAELQSLRARIAVLEAK